MDSCSSVPKHGEIVVTTHDQLDEVLTLERAWRSLEGGAFCSAAQSFDYCTAAWRTKPKSRHSRLNVVSVEIAGQIAAIWPLCSERRGLATVLTHLGCGNEEEYAGPLLAGGALGLSAARAALAHVMHRADIIRIYNIPPQNALCMVLDDTDVPIRKGDVYSPVIDETLHMSWNEWLETRSKSFRYELRNGRKRLTQHGAIRFENVKSEPELNETIAWMFEVKRADLVQRDVIKSWVYGIQARQCLAFAAAATPQINVFALKVDAVTAAACILFETDYLCEFFMTSYNREFYACSPGNLLIAEVAKQCFSNQKIFDFRLTNDVYKGRWCKATTPYRRFVVAATPLGWAGLQLGRMTPAVHAVKAYAKRTLRPLRYWIRRFRGPQSFADLATGSSTHRIATSPPH